MLPYVLLAVILAIALLYHRLALLAWLGAGGVLLIGWRIEGVQSPLLFALCAMLLAVPALLLGLPPVRRALFGKALLGWMSGMLPRLGHTERVALDAGTVWWDGELFSGAPDWRKLLDTELPPLSAREQDFLDNQVNTLCGLLDDWEIHQRRDLSQEAWDYIRRERFFGMIIPESEGGLGFSAIAQSRVVTKIASRSVAAAVTVMVPNSLGPGELLLHYGTDAQKRRYLGPLARGEEIPCFALTGPEAGSDAAATQSEGIVERRIIDGVEVIGLRMNWKKRYITLAPVATLIGVAFRLKDPDHLIGDIGDRGITCALVPRDTPGIEIGQRHDPMGVPFMNGPTIGRDVWVPLDEAVIGGREGVGQGWRMLMESLAAGRSISLPALSVGAVQMATRICGAYATVREQFDTPIGRFEGIEEPLTRIGGLNYLMTAARTVTCGALDLGEKPAVIGAIVKAYLTEGMRASAIDAMDIRAGAAIQRGPRNMMARAWDAVPIGITVEGANILTRSMIIYGQGAIRCHPYVQEEILSVADRDVRRFDRAFFSHLVFVVSNGVRGFLLGITGARITSAPVGDSTAVYYRRLTRFSSGFAFVSDIAMGLLGGQLKRREKISGRLADALAWMYLASCALKRHHDEPKTDYGLDMARWSAEHALFRVQAALAGVIDNFPVRWIRWLMRLVVFPLGARLRPPTDTLGGRVARELLEDRAARIALTADVYIPPADEPGLGELEAALEKAVGVIPVETKLRDAVRAGKLERAPGHLLDDYGLAAGVIDQQEYDLLNAARNARDEVIQVDAFDPEVYDTLR